MSRVQLTMLNKMAAREFAASAQTHVAWGLKHLDLKDDILGRALLDLTDEQAAQAMDIVRAHGLHVYCLSSQLCYEDIDLGELEFRRRLDGKVRRLADLAGIFQPSLVRLLAARSTRRTELGDLRPHLDTGLRWLPRAYADAVDMLAAAGHRPTIENEVHGCLFTTPPEILHFFALLDRSRKVSFTWDIQNLWQMGTYPSLPVYEQLRPLIGFVHLKGGAEEVPGGPLVWNTALQDATWPVLDILRRVIADGASPVICLNPSHGNRRPGYDYANVPQRDLAFLRASFQEIE